jgi:hypothetical protein
LNFVAKVFDAFPADLVSGDRTDILDRYKHSYPVSTAEQELMNQHYGGKRLHCLSLHRNGKCGPDLAVQLLKLSISGITETSHASILQQVMESSDVFCVIF